MVTNPVYARRANMIGIWLLGQNTSSSDVLTIKDIRSSGFKKVRFVDFDYLENSTDRKIAENKTGFLVGRRLYFDVSSATIDKSYMLKFNKGFLSGNFISLNNDSGGCIAENQNEIEPNSFICNFPASETISISNSEIVEIVKLF